MLLTIFYRDCPLNGTYWKGVMKQLTQSISEFGGLPQTLDIFFVYGAGKYLGLPTFQALDMSTFCSTECKALLLGR